MVDVPDPPSAPTMQQRTSSLADSKYDVKEASSVEHVEESSVKGSYGDDGELLAPDRRVAAERKLVRKLDFRLLPTIVLIFILNYIDVRFATFAPLSSVYAALNYYSGQRCRPPV